MAGDWIKMDCTTPDKPEVLALTVKMGWDDPDLTVGKLFRLWRWFDQHTTDGNAVGVTSALLDRQVGVTGFIDAVASVGWLEVTSNGIRLSKFEKHNGSSAKSRAQTAKRVASHKTNAKTNADTVTGALPREEKRREEYSVTNVTGGGTANRAKTAAEHRKSQLWRQMKEFLVDSGESKDLKAAGAVITKAISRYDEATALGAIEATLYARPAGAIAYLEGACQQATGQRENKQESLEAGNLAAAKRFTESLQ
jgi:hypothetical protein